MSTLTEPVNSTRNPFITSGGAVGSGSEKHYEELIWRGDEVFFSGTFFSMCPYGGRPAAPSRFPALYKNLTGKTKTCRFGSAGLSGPNGGISLFRVLKNGVQFETVQITGWSSTDSTSRWDFNSPLEIAPNDEILVGDTSISVVGMNHYFVMVLEWDGDLP